MKFQLVVEVDHVQVFAGIPLIPKIFVKKIRRGRLDSVIFLLSFGILELFNAKWLFEGYVLGVVGHAAPLQVPRARRNFYLLDGIPKPNFLLFVFHLDLFEDGFCMLNFFNGSRRFKPLFGNAVLSPDVGAGRQPFERALVYRDECFRLFGFYKFFEVLLMLLQVCHLRYFHSHIVILRQRHDALIPVQLFIEKCQIRRQFKCANGTDGARAFVAAIVQLAAALGRIFL